MTESKMHSQLIDVERKGSRFLIREARILFPVSLIDSIPEPSAAEMKSSGKGFLLFLILGAHFDLPEERAWESHMHNLLILKVISLGSPGIPHILWRGSR